VCNPDKTPTARANLTSYMVSLGFLDIVSNTQNTRNRSTENANEVIKNRMTFIFITGHYLISVLIALPFSVSINSFR